MNYTQVHVTELNDPGGVVECTWATGVELARAALWGKPNQPPATAAERESLRIAGGGSDSGGANYDQLAAGCQRRYGLTLPLSTTFPSSVPVGTFMGVQGRYSALPVHYRRWDPTFGAGHSGMVYNLTGTPMWCDPLAPPSVRDPRGGTIAWQGEPITLPEVAAYFHALPGAHVATVRLGPGPVAAPAAWLVVISQPTPVYAANSTASRVIDTAYSMSARATRSLVGGRWWYTITSARQFVGGHVVADGHLTATRL